MKKCAYCGASNEDNAVFCRQCGASLLADSKHSFSAYKKRSFPATAVIAIVGILIIIVIAVLVIMHPRGSQPKPQVTPAAVDIQQSEPAASTPSPTAIPTPTPAPVGPSVNDIAGCDKRIVIPDDDSWLDDYETKYVKSKYGNCIYLIWGPSKDYDHFDSVDEGSAVTELARQGDYSLVIAPGARIGWCKTQLIVKEYYTSQSSPTNTGSAGNASSTGNTGSAGFSNFISYVYNSLPGGARPAWYNCPIYDFDSSGSFVISLGQYSTVSFSDDAMGSACIGDTVDLGTHTAKVTEIRWPQVVLLDSGDSIVRLSNGYWYAVDSSNHYIAIYAVESPFYVSNDVKVIDHICGTTEYGTDALTGIFEYPYDSDNYIYYYLDSNGFISCVERLSGPWAP